MSQPIRIQLRRAKGWRMPANTVKVDRTTEFGNPFTVAGAVAAGYRGSDAELAAMCVNEFRGWIEGRVHSFAPERVLSLRSAIGDLRGKNLACWCALGQTCHADVLLELANK